jgi:hypothetical protein
MAFDSKSLGLVGQTASAIHARHDLRDTAAASGQRILFKFGGGADGKTALRTRSVDAVCRQGRIRRVDRVVDTRTPRVYEGDDEPFDAQKRVVGRS